MAFVWIEKVQTFLIELILASFYFGSNALINKV